MSEKNNFQELEKQQIEDYSKVTDKVKKSVDNSISTFAFVGNVIDLYFTKMFDVMFKLTSTDDSLDNDSNPIEKDSQSLED